MKTLGKIKMDPLVIGGYETACLLLAEVFPAMPHEAMVSYSMAIFGRTLAEIPDEKWKEAESTVGIPCGVEGCTCEKFRTEFFPILNKLREWGKSDLVHRAKEEGSEESFPA